MVAEGFPLEVGFLQTVALDHGPHGAVQNEDAIGCSMTQEARALEVVVD